MAITDADGFASPGVLTRLRSRLRDALAGEHMAAQRMAGGAFVIRVAGAGVVFLSQVFLARWMGGFEYGTYVYAWTWLLVIGDLIHFGLPITAQRCIPEYTQRNELDRLRGFLLASRWAVFAIGSLVAIAGAVVVWIMSRSPGHEGILPLYLACATLPFYTLSNMFDGIARAYNAVAIALLPQNVLRPAVLIAVMAVAHFGGFLSDATTAMAALAFATWTTTLLQLFMLNRKLKRSVPSGPAAYEFGHWMRTSLPLVAVWAFFMLLFYSDVLVLRQFRPPEEVAHYYAASRILTLVAFIHFSVTAAVAHRFAAHHVAGDRKALADFASSTVRWTFWPSLAVTIIILALGKPILWLFGPDFVVAYPLMFVMSISLLARSAVGPAERALSMMGEQRICALIYATAFALNLALAFSLAPRFGGMGVAVALATAVATESILLFAIAKRRLGLHLFIWRPASLRQ